LAARTAAHHAIDAADLTELLDILGLDAIEGLAPPANEPPAEPSVTPIELEADSAARLHHLLCDVLPSAHGQAARPS
jgi:hypothetical protein